MVLILPVARSLSAMQARMAAALRTAPGNPRSSCSLALYGLRLASSASRLMAAAISACLSQRSAS